MPQSATYLSVTKFDSDGDGIPDTSAQGTRTQEFDDQGNLVHDRSTIDLNGDSIPDFVDESRFSYDTNNNVVTQVVTERQVAENSAHLTQLVICAVNAKIRIMINNRKGALSAMYFQDVGVERLQERMYHYCPNSHVGYH